MVADGGSDVALVIVVAGVGVVVNGGDFPLITNDAVCLVCF